MKSFRDLREKTLTPAEKKKREEIAKAMERDNPGIDMGKKMAIATATAKKVAEQTLDEGAKTHFVYQAGVPKTKQVVHRGTEQSSKDWITQNAKHYIHKGRDFTIFKGKYPNVKPSDSLSFRHVAEEANLEEGLYHVEYGRSGKLTHQVVATDANDAHKKAMAHLKKKNPKLAHPDYADTFKKPSVTHIKGNEPRADKYKTEATEIDEISLSHLSNTIAKSTGTKNIKTAMKPGEIKNGLDDLKKRLGTLGKEPKMAKEAYEDDEPASPDEASMAMRQLGFIEYAAEEVMDHIKSGKEFPEWMQNKLSKLHGQMESLHSALGDHGEDEMKENTKDTEISEVSMDTAKSAYYKRKSQAFGAADRGSMDYAKKLAAKARKTKAYIDKRESVEEATELDELNKKTLGSYVKKASGSAAGIAAVATAQAMSSKGKSDPNDKRQLRNRLTGISRATDKLTKEEVAEANRKGAPKMTGDSIAIQRAKDAALNKALGRTKTGRKAPKRTMTSTQRSLAQLRGESVMSADRKPEKFVKPDGKVGIRMVRVDKKVVDKDA